MATVLRLFVRFAHPVAAPRVAAVPYDVVDTDERALAVDPLVFCTSRGRNRFAFPNRSARRHRVSHRGRAL